MGNGASGLGVTQSLIDGVEEPDFLLHIVPGGVGGEMLDGFENLIFDGHGGEV